MGKKTVLFFSIVFLLLINTAPAHAIGKNPSNLYVVKSGDSLPAIAHTFGTTVEDLKLTNGLQSDTVVVGQKLYVPFVYEVMAGDSLDKISAAYHSSVERIKAANGLSATQLYLGQKLLIPPQRMNMDGQYILMTKEEFKNWLFHHQFSRKITIIQHHHTWLPSYKHFHGSNHFAMLKGMENFHIEKMGWKTIAQNITTFPDGKIAVSRPFNIAPEGTIGAKANTTGLTIENVGNFDIGHDVMTQAQRDTIVTITALLCIKFRLTPSIDSITYHHWWSLRTGERVLDNGPDYNVKTCPGTGFFGGNSTVSARNNLYPLVSRKMQEIAESK
ncbi:LysM peptidoglycan-binding domain-containing protein [Neobacillus sp. OS1-2]|uniref:peptidoglycan recognition protein family protein n=1 Tax=Neobacillus sp. OS1-2 TaxID=3070680 RepID=UPI0027DF7892|nr:LysM peptidoglycan-binding domain-containing protein [Neobacillus sp. OS1-2]WML38202.1 LysM peptidoglycan-binding domain-containing protein [Neobacillus sp. OS1-2]